MKNTSKRIRLARILIIVPTIFYGVVPPIIDFSASHVINPNWPGHARLHMAWLLMTNFLLSATALVLLFKKIPNLIAGTRIAGVISLCVYSGFFLAALTRKLYGGTLSDADGMAPIMGVDGNLLVFIPLTIFLLFGLYLIFTIRAEILK